MSRVKLKDLRVSLIQPDSTFKYVPIDEGVYCAVLNLFSIGWDSEPLQIYEVYMSELDKYHYRGKTASTEISYEEFMNLLFDIRDKGFKIQDPKIKLEGNKVLNGQHRAAILYYLYPDAELTVDEKGEAIEVWNRLDVAEGQ